MNAALVSHHLPPPPFEIYENENLNGGDSFGLEFAASQWQRLVTNAEGLFQNLVQNGLSEDSRNQIEQWLCLKRECEDCFNNDNSIIGLYDKTLRSLERIDEVTESETKSSSSTSSTGTSDSKSDSESDFDEPSDELTCDESVSSKKGDNKFTEKLESQLNKFRTATDCLVNSYIGDLQLEKNAIDNSNSVLRLNNLNSLNRRRRSVLACDILPQVPTTCATPAEGGGGEWDQNSNGIADSGGEMPKSLKERMIQKLKKSEKNSQDKLTILNNNLGEEEAHKLSNLKSSKDSSIGAGNPKKNYKETMKNSGKFLNKNECSNSKKKMSKIVKLQLKMEEESKGNLENEKKLNKSENKQKSGAKPKSKDSIVSSNSDNGKAICTLLRDNEEEESFRREIINLRETRDLLMDQRRSLDSKLNKDKVFNNDDERKFLEVDEAIEAIDAVIEHKNELLCGHKGVLYDSLTKEKGEIMLMDRLMKLSEPEMRVLLYKYFKKTVDLRESGKEMEQLLAVQDYQIEKQSWKIQYRLKIWYSQFFGSTKQCINFRRNDSG